MGKWVKSFRELLLMLCSIRVLSQKNEHQLAQLKAEENYQNEKNVDSLF